VGFARERVLRSRGRKRDVLMLEELWWHNTGYKVQVMVDVKDD
jgi:hypothetical protein